MRELGQVDALGARDAVVGAHDAVGQGVELRPEPGIADSRHDLGQGVGRAQLLGHELFDPELPGLGQDAAALLEGQVAVGPRRGDGEADDAPELVGARGGRLPSGSRLEKGEARRSRRAAADCPCAAS